MSDLRIEGYEFKPGFKGMAKDTGSDQTMFKGVHWGKAMMWIFLLSDTFIFSCFLISYMKGRGSTIIDWPNPSEVFGLHVFGVDVPLLLIAIMTFVLITSSGTMALAVKYGYEKNKKMCGWFILATAIGGLTFVGMQAYEWSSFDLAPHASLQAPWSKMDLSWPLANSQSLQVSFQYKRANIQSS